MTPSRSWRTRLPALLLAVPVLGLAQDPYVVQLWQVHDDLPHNHVHDVLQARDGHIWVATPEGVARYTGVHFGIQFDRFHSGNTPAIPDNSCTVLAEDNEGGLWLGLSGGQVVRRDDDGFALIPLPDGWPSAPILHMVEAGPATMMVLSSAGALARLDADQPAELLQASPPGNRLDLVRDNEGTSWLLSRDGLRPLSTTATAAIPGPAACAGPARDGGLWVLNQQSLRRWHDGRWVETIGPLPGLPAPATRLLETSDATLLIGSDGSGLVRVVRTADGADFVPVEGVAGESVRGLCEDHEGSVWVGTASGGLIRLARRRASTITITGEFGPADLLCVAAGSNNDLWVGTDHDGLYHLAGTGAASQVLPPTLDNLAVSTIHRMQDGAIWFGLRERGMWTWDREQATPLPGWPWPKAEVQCLLQDSTHAVWAGMADGLAVFRDGQWQRVRDDDHVLSDDIRCLAEDAQGDLWFGSAGGGVGRLHQQGIIRLDRSHGLGSSTVYALLAEPDGTVWAGTQGGGFVRMRGRKWTAITARHGLHHDTIGQILDDGSGRIWLATLGGLVSADMADLHRCADGELDAVPAILMALKDGLTQVDFACGSQPGAAQTADHRLWFVAGEGLGVVHRDAADTLRNRVPPPMVITSLRANDVNVPFHASDTAERPRLGPETAQIEIRYNALSYIAPRRVRFQYRLLGLGEDWVDAGSDRTVRFGRLPPGDYTFQVRGCNNDGVWNEDGVTLAFYLTPHLWQRLGFRLAMGLAGGAFIAGAAYSLARLRNRRRLAQAQQKEALERERGRIARDMHDEIGAQLTRIALLSRLALGDNASDDKRKGLLSTINQASKSSVQRFDQIVWAVNPRNDTLQHFADYVASYAVAYFEQTGVACSLSIPLTLPDVPLSAAIRNNLFRTCEEAMSNALSHAQATEVNVALAVKQDRLVVRVSDNGTGFDRPMDRLRDSGLAIMRKRLSDIGGECIIESSPKAGTTVEMQITLQGLRPPE